MNFHKYHLALIPYIVTIPCVGLDKDLKAKTKFYYWLFSPITMCYYFALGLYWVYYPEGLKIEEEPSFKLKLPKLSLKNMWKFRNFLRKKAKEIIEE